MKHLPAKLVKKSAEKLVFTLCPHRHRSWGRPGQPG